MPTVRASRTLHATPEAIWRVVGDPSHLTRWWPRARRVEAATEETWTVAFRTQKGKTIRVDFELLDSQEPNRRSWYQRLENSPFEKLLSESVTEVIVENDGDGSTVTLIARQKMRGLSKLGGPVVRKASRKLLGEALDGLERTCGR